MRSNKAAIFALFIFCFPLFGQKVHIVQQADLLRLFQPDSSITVINFWATWCKPCIAEMPIFTQADSLLQEKGVQFVFVNFDFAEDSNRVAGFVKRNRIPGSHYLIDETDMNRLINAVDSNWGGGLPATWILSGKTKWSFYSHFKNYNDFQNVLLPLIAKKSENE